MLTFDQARKDEANKILRDRQEVLREQMFGGSGIRTYQAMPEQGTRDAAALAEFTRRMTEYVDLELDRMDFPQTTYRKVFTLKTGISRGADAYVKYEVEANGKDDWIDEEGQTVPMISVGTIPTVRAMFPRGVGYRITTTEILRATQSRQPIDMEKPEESRRVVEEGLDRIYWLGDSALGVYGLLTHPNIPSDAATTGTWSSATAAEIRTDILTALNTTMLLTHMVEGQQWDLAVPNSQYLKLTQTEINTYTTETVAEWLIRKIPQLRAIISTQRLYQADDGDDIGFFIPIGARYGYGLQPGDIQTEGPHQVTMLGQDYLVTGKTGGFFTNKPLMFRGIEGI